MNTMKTDMNDVEERIARVLDGNLPDEERRALRDALMADPEAAALLRVHEGLCSRLRALPEVPVPAGFEARLHARLEARRVPAWRRFLAMAWMPVSLACAAAALWMVHGGGGPGPGPAGVSAAALAPAPVQGTPEVMLRVRVSAPLHGEARAVLGEAGLASALDHDGEGVVLNAGVVRAGIRRAGERLPLEMRGELPADDDAGVRVRAVLVAP